MPGDEAPKDPDFYFEYLTQKPVSRWTGEEIFSCPVPLLKPQVDPNAFDLSAAVKVVDWGFEYATSFVKNFKVTSLRLENTDARNEVATAAGKALSGGRASPRAKDDNYTMGLLELCQENLNFLQIAKAFTDVAVGAANHLVEDFLTRSPRATPLDDSHPFIGFRAFRHDLVYIDKVKHLLAIIVLGEPPRISMEEAGRRYAHEVRHHHFLNQAIAKSRTKLSGLFPQILPTLCCNVHTHYGYRVHVRPLPQIDPIILLWPLPANDTLKNEVAEVEAALGCKTGTLLTATADEELRSVMRTRNPCLVRTSEANHYQFHCVEALFPRDVSSPRQNLWDRLRPELWGEQFLLRLQRAMSFVREEVGAPSQQDPEAKGPKGLSDLAKSSTARVLAQKTSPRDHLSPHRQVLRSAQEEEWKGSSVSFQQSDGTLNSGNTTFSMLSNNMSPRSWLASLQFTPHNMRDVDDGVDRRLSGLLRTKFMAIVAKELDDLVDHSPVDSYTLTKFMHERGINMRYIGALAGMVKYDSARMLLVVDGVARTCKHILRREIHTLIEKRRFGLADTRFLNSVVNDCFVQFFNSVVGVGPRQEKYFR